MVVLRKALGILCVLLGTAGVCVIPAAASATQNLEPVRVIAKIRTGAGPCIATAIQGRVWVSNFNAWTLVRVDPRSNRLVGRPLPVGKQPCGLSFGAGSVWVGPFGSRMIERLDPRTGKLTARIRIGGMPYDVLFHA